ncbi:hypothetical protein TSMEX_004878 [Taenia solium]|eukprot:TsM_000611000 transcript=TsM_000611000 gene=TsM_000611000
MPIFSKKFSLPRMPSRKASSMTNLSQLDASTRSNEFGLDCGVVKARLSGRNLIFKNGRWRVEDGRGDSGGEPVGKEIGRLKNENRKLYEENNLLKIKVDILLDMPKQIDPALPGHDRNVLLAGHLRADAASSGAPPRIAFLQPPLSGAFCYKTYQEKSLTCCGVDKLKLAETTAEVRSQENEIESLRSLIHRKPLSTFSQPAMSTA